jgi:solute carrier family 25 (mitochondrial phosphate transporter), member 3
MNDPLLARVMAPNQPLPASTIFSKEMRKKMPKDSDPLSLAARAERDANNDGNGGGGGCIGRACYDRAVQAIAYPRAEMDSYTTFQNPEDANKAQRVESAIRTRSSASAPPTWVDTPFNNANKKVVSATSSGPDSSLPALPTWGGRTSSSAQLLSLLPSGIGLEYDRALKRYRLGVGDSMPDWTKAASSTKPLDPEFGPRGRSPIERDMELGISTYLRFCASGAICCSAVHLALTPIDVVKTKVQTNPVKYPGIISSFQKVLKEEGAGTFFTGWAPTFTGFFIWGGLSYTLTELVRRYLSEKAGSDAMAYEVPIILAASAVGAFFGSFFISPFETVRIRTVSQPDFAPNFVGVFLRIVQEEGVGSLFSAVPVFLLKEIPFAMAKFTVFDLSTAWMYGAFPAAREDLQLSLLVSLAGGTLGGVTAALVSNPADATISEMKKSATKVGPVAAAKLISDRGGQAAFFKGLQLRMFFYSLLVSLQFLVYDSVRFALGIGTDDLKLYLDVLGGALGASGGPV